MGPWLFLVRLLCCLRGLKTLAKILQAFLISLEMRLYQGISAF